MAEEKGFDLFETINPPSQTDQDLAALLFTETAPPPQEATQTGRVEETLAPAETAESEEAPKKPGFLARIKGLFRRKAPGAEAIGESTAVMEPPPEEEEASEEEAEEGAPPRPYKKVLVIVLAALAVLGASIGGTVLTFQHMEAAKRAEWKKREADLAAEKAQLEKQKAELAALKAQNEKLAQEAAAAPKAPDQAESRAAAPAAGTSKPSPEAGEENCAVVGKETAAQTIKRCIEAYNRATGRTK